MRTNRKSSVLVSPPIETLLTVSQTDLTMASENQPFTQPTGTDETGTHPFTNFPTEIKFMIYQSAMLPLDKQRLVVLRFANPDGQDDNPEESGQNASELSEGKAALGKSGPNDTTPTNDLDEAEIGCQLKLMKAKALARSDPIPIANKLRLFGQGADVVVDNHMRKAPLQHTFNTASLNNVGAHFSRDLFFLYNVPTTYRSDDLGGRTPTHQLSLNASEDFSAMDNVMLLASDVAAIMQAAAESVDPENVQANFFLRLQDWQSVLARKRTAWSDEPVPLNLENLFIFADDDPVAVERLKNGQLERGDLIVEHASVCWDMEGIGQTMSGEDIGIYIHNSTAVRKTWGESVGAVIDLWVGIHFRAQKYWAARLSDPSGPEWGEEYEHANLPELWPARIK